MKPFLFTILALSLSTTFAFAHLDDERFEGYNTLQSGKVPEIRIDTKSLKPIDIVFQEESIEDFGLKEGELVLTIDDGPSKYSPQILALLKQYNIRAMFFLVGEQVEWQKKLVEQEANAHHLIGNHTMHHLTKFDSDEQLVQELLDNHKLIAPYIKSSGTKRFYYRAPGGAWSSAKAITLNKDPVLSQYMGAVYWNIGSSLVRDQDGKLVAAADWACWQNKISAEECAEAYYQDILKKGKGVILMHDVNANAPEFLRLLLEKLTNGGTDGDGNGEWKFRNFDEMEYMKKYEI